MNRRESLQGIAGSLAAALTGVAAEPTPTPAVPTKPFVCYECGETNHNGTFCIPCAHEALDRDGKDRKNRKNHPAAERACVLLYGVLIAALDAEEGLAAEVERSRYDWPCHDLIGFAHTIEVMVAAIEGGLYSCCEVNAARSGYYDRKCEGN